MDSIQMWTQVDEFHMCDSSIKRKRQTKTCKFEVSNMLEMLKFLKENDNNNNNNKYN